LELEERGVIRLDGGASPHTTSALKGVSSLPSKKRIGKSPRRRPFRS
jgi:hypothetical protein